MGGGGDIFLSTMVTVVAKQLIKMLAGSWNAHCKVGVVWKVSVHGLDPLYLHDKWLRTLHGSLDYPQLC